MANYSLHGLTVMDKVLVQLIPHCCVTEKMNHRRTISP